MGGEQFAIDVKKFCEKTKIKVDLVVRKVLIDLSAGVVAMSPVDTGRFRANWQYGVATMPEGTIDAFDKSGGAGSTTAGQLAAAISNGPAAAGNVCWIVNNLPYGHRLEYDGWSKQAPAGMVRVTMQRYQEYFANAIESVRSV